MPNDLLAPQEPVVDPVIRETAVSSQNLINPDEKTTKEPQRNTYRLSELKGIIPEYEMKQMRLSYVQAKRDALIKKLSNDFWKDRPSGIALTNISKAPGEAAKAFVRNTESQLLGGIGLITSWIGENMQAYRVNPYKDTFKFALSKKEGITQDEIDSKLTRLTPNGFVERFVDKLRDGLIAIQDPEIDNRLEAEGPQGFQRLINRIGKELSSLGEDSVTFWNKQATEGWEAPDEEIFRGSYLENPNFARTMAEVSGAIPALGFATMISFATGSPMAGRLYFGALQGADTFRKAKESGKSIGQANKYAMLDGVFTAVSEGLTLDAILKKEGLKKIIITEGGTEGVQQFWSNLVARFGYEKTRNLFDGVIENVVVGAISGGIVGGVSKKSTADIAENVRDLTQNGLTNNDITEAITSVKDEIVNNATQINRKLRTTGTIPVEKIEVPQFKTLDDAVEFGKKNADNPSAIVALRDRYLETENKIVRMMENPYKTEEEIATILDETEQSQLLEQAIFSATPIESSDSQPEIINSADVYEDIKAKLLDAGMSEEQADANAKLWKARSEQAAKEQGISVGQWYAKVRPTVKTSDSTIPERALQQSDKELEEKNLVAMHNLTAENILHAEKIGGLAIPSISIGKVEHPLEGFGEISLIANKDLINPRNKSSKAFNADIYSPRYPNVQYEINKKELKNISEDFKVEAKELGIDLEDEIAGSDFVYRGIEELKNIVNIQLKYLHEKGIKVEIPKKTQETTYTKFNPDIKNVIGDYTEVFNIVDDKKFLAEYEKLRLAYMKEKEQIAEIEGATKEKAAAEAEHFGKLFYKDGKVNPNIFRAIKREIQSTKEAGTVDFYEAKRNIRDAIYEHWEDFNGWVVDKYSGLINRERLYVGEDKNYNKKYITHNLENVVKVMKKASLRGGEGFNYGIGNLRASVAKQYKSIAEIQKDREKILSKEGFEKAAKFTDNEFDSILAEAIKVYPHKSDFSTGDTFIRVLIDGIRANNIEKELTEFGFGKMDFNRIRAFLSILRDMPTEYFEVKMQRAVGLNEFSGAVIPKDINKKVVDILDKNKIAYRFYDPAKEGDRARAIKELSEEKEILFQEGARGWVELGKAGQNKITLSSKANASTFIHESAHIWLEDIFRFSKTNPSENWKTISKWLGADISQKKLTTAQHEKFARSFEKYLAEGKAPSTGLRGVFEQFKKWMTDIYGELKNLNVNVSQEVKALFDRMLSDRQTTDFVLPKDVRNFFDTNLKKEMAKFSERSNEKRTKQEEAELVKAQLEEITKFNDILRKRINTDKNPDIKEEIAEIPKEFTTKNKKALSADEAMDIINGEGGFKKFETLREMAHGLQDTINTENNLKERLRNLNADIKEASPKLITKRDTTLLKEKIDNIRRGFEIGQRKSRSEVKLVQNELIELLNNSALDANDKAKFIKTIKNVQTYEELVKSFPVIEDRISSLTNNAQARELRKKIHEELAGTLPTMQGGKKKGKFGAEIQHVLDRMREITKLTQEEARRLLTIPAFKDGVPSFNETIENKLLNVMSGLENRNVEELQDILDTIQTLKRTGEAEIFLKELARRDREKENIEKATAVINGIKPASKKRTETLKEKVRKAVSYSYVSIVGWNDKMDILSEDDSLSKQDQSFLSNFARVSDEVTNEKKGVQVATDRIVKDFMDAFGLRDQKQVERKLREDSVIQDIGSFVDGFGDSVTLSFSKSELRKRWMELQDESISQTFYKAEVDEDGKRFGMGYTQEMVEAIRTNLTQEDLVFAKAQFQFYKEFYPGVNEVYKEIYGIDLDFNSFYSPIAREHTRSDVFDEFLKEQNYRRSVSSGSLKARIKNYRPIIEQSDIEVLMRHVVEMEHFKAWAVKIRDINSVFGNSEVRRTIESKFGKDFMRSIDKHIINFTRGGIDKSNTYGLLERARLNFAKSVLAVKPALTVKQMVSFVAYAETIPTADFVAGITDFIANTKKAIDTLNESPLMKNRSKDLNRDIKQISKTEAFSRLRKNPNFLNSLLFNVKLGDKGAIYLGGWAVYKHALKQGKTHKQALLEFERVTANTQQSGDIDQLSDIQSGGTFARLFTMFISSQNAYFRREISALRNVAKGRITKKEFAKKFILYHFVLPMLFQLVVDFGKWDEEHQWRAALTGSLNGIFMLNDIIDGIISSIQGDHVFPNEVSVMTLGNGINKAISDLKNEDVMEAMKDLMNDTVGPATGLPIKYFNNMIEGFSDIGYEDYRQGIGKVLGWSPYYLRE